MGTRNEEVRFGRYRSAERCGIQRFSTDTDSSNDRCLSLIEDAPRGTAIQGAESRMFISGIDPAPSKGTTIFDGSSFSQMNPRQLVAYLDELRTKAQALICWDAPLTGPSATDIEATRDGDFSQRTIERFFSRTVTGFKTPGGISVLPYSGCPHWALSRAVVGLPRLGPWDSGLEDLPFKFVSTDSPPTQPGHYIVEVHPAVAIWLWCKEAFPSGPWDYKKNSDTLAVLWTCLSDRLEPCGLPSLKDFAPKNDDELDAFVSFALGFLWLHDPDKVFLLGDGRTGSMLLPRDQDLEVAFSEFCDRFYSSVPAPPQLVRPQ